MKPYLLSGALGLLVGVIYAVLGSKSPAPPVVALVGLLGMLVGEQAVPLIRQMLALKAPVTATEAAAAAVSLSDSKDRDATKTLH